VTFVLTLLIAAGAGAQRAATPAFEVASVKANRGGSPMRAYPTIQPGGRVFAINLPLRDLIRVAYGLDENQLIISSPLADALFDVEARADANVTNEQAVRMLRALLADRFALKAHTETRRLPVYGLVRVNATSVGPRIKPSGPECAPISFPAADGGTAPPPPAPPRRRRTDRQSATTILIWVPTGGCEFGAAWFITARLAGFTAPPLRSASDAHVSPARTT
jgi:uncharacterized protein (TIGR03435 family)